MNRVLIVIGGVEGEYGDRKEEIVLVGELNLRFLCFKIYVWKDYVFFSKIMIN